LITGPPTSVAGRPFFCSWSGGKDSCLSLYRAIQAGGRPTCLLTIMSEEGRLSRSHGLPIVFRSASWESYETVFSAALRELRSAGIEAGVFGDIDIDAHREWCLRVCHAAGIQALHPLWKQARRELLEQFIELKFQAVVVVVKADILGPEWLGRVIDRDAVLELEKAGIDPSGEFGEYHTFVTCGPIFSSPIAYRMGGAPLLRDGYWLSRVSGGIEDDPRKPAPPGPEGRPQSVI
jgi:diphthine-ammonia ligase